MPQEGEQAMKKESKIKHYSREQIRRNRMIALFFLAALGILLVILIVWAISHSLGSSAPDASSLSDSGGSTVSSKVTESASMAESVPDSAASLESAAGSSAASSSSSSSSASGSSSGSKDTYYEASIPMLVGPENYMPDGFVPTVVSVGDNYKLETKAAAAWKDMQAAAKNDGVSLWIISAYRTLARQTELFNQKVDEYKNLGYTTEEATKEAGKWVAVPGTSEHCLGYAADLCSLEESFDQSSQFKWLQSHCAEYGFILRYPKDKVSVTKISYEPWHYRYVGSNHAKIIMDNGLCLEEYLEQYGA